MSLKNNILVFDIEGTDSKERKEDRGLYEKTTAMLGLAISDVFLINIWFNVLGCHTACNYDVLKQIFEVHIKHFSKT